MLYHLLTPLQEYLSFLRLFQYITFRSLYAALTALLFVMIFGRPMIERLRRMRFKEEIRALGPESHKSKTGTPTMGGVIILLGIGVSVGLWGNFTSLYLLLLIAATVSLGLLGFADDYIKSIKKKKSGVSARVKLLVQFGTAFGVAGAIYFMPSNPDAVSSLYVPFINKAVMDMGMIWILFAAIVIVGTSNAVNLTDGLDGLAIGSVIIVAACLGLMTYISGHKPIAEYLRIPYIPAGAELTVFLAAVVGASMGFLWFNANPASVFMGDTGALSLGGIIGVVAVMIKKEIFLFIVGGVFVMEALSVIIQVVSFKTRGKRVFKMAPLHHHLELSGWPEQKVVVRLWLVGVILAIIGLSTLKIL
jgi:phospho-N-acetylmuramoyl-pentapeptide-transferase